jgi:hypothetical protein
MVLNPVPSSGESAANLTFGGRIPDAAMKSSANVARHMADLSARSPVCQSRPVRGSVPGY